MTSTLAGAVDALAFDGRSASPSPEPPMVELRDLVKVYSAGRRGESVRALDGVSLAVSEGELFGLLGPNGAGKSTAIRILVTLLLPTAGRAWVAGHDVAAEPTNVRRKVGIAMQAVVVDPLSTGRENLELIGRLHRVPGRELRQRVDDLLELIGLTDVASKVAGTYSGGMKRRLDLASALVHRPQVLFLDEPTAGLDPPSRTALWDELLRIRAAGTTMFLTTHYMEEADRLCDRLAIIDEGRVAVLGSPSELKRSVGAETVTLALDSTGADDLAHRQAVVARMADGLGPSVSFETTTTGVRLAVPDAHAAIPAVLRRLDADGVRVSGLSIAGPTLDDVFLRYCGTRIRTEAADGSIDVGWYG